MNDAGAGPTSARYVPDDDFWPAMQDHEAEALDELNIPRNSRDHIHCPYPDHPDKHPSWRWDLKKRKAFCTCSKGDDIVSVVMKVKGLDYAQAKLWLVEHVLHRDDLIRTTGKRGPHWYLNPPPDKSDDSLPRAYLACRLGLPPADVLMPTTPVAGWRALGYYDGGLDHHVGDFPCAVFGLVNPRRRIHVHRIYVKRGGQGKAEISAGKDGTSRKPKKAAPLHGDQIDGRCAYWGDPATALTIILCEGIETGQGVAQAHKAEIAVGTIAAVAAVSAGWMPQWRPWPVNKIAIIVADRDEARDPQKAGYREGEKKARELAEKLVAEGLTVMLALPGEPGTDCDALNVWEKGGADAVRALIGAAKICSPAPDDDPESTEVQLEDFVAYMPEHKYIFRPTRQLWPGASVNARLPPVPVGDDEISATRHLDQTSPAEQMTWVPGEAELIHGRLLNEGGWIERKGVTTYNLFRPAIIVPRQGDVALWLKHVKTLYPDATKHMITWLAHKVQRPAEKINHAIVLGGEQGIGKDAILEPIKQAVGAWNFQDVSPRQVLERFNGYLKSVILRISEARDLGDADRFKLYDHLKAIIAAPPDTLRIDEKNIREYVIPNVTGVIITTNHKVGGIHLPPDDRRHFVVWSPLTRRRFTPKYFMRLYRWYADGGAEIVAHYLATLDISKFNPKAPPPQTEAFWQMVNSNRAPEAAEMADRLEALGNPAVVTLDQLRVGAPEDFKAWLCERKNSRAILHRLEECGYEAVRNLDATDGLWRISGKRQAVYGRRDLSLQEKLKAAGELL
jgi:Family of unknown function (DUF5906)/Toprim domain